MGVNRLPKTVTRQHRDCDLNPGPSAPKSSTLTTQLPCHPSRQWYFLNGTPHSATSKCSYNFKIFYRHFQYHNRKRISNYATLLSKKICNTLLYKKTSSNRNSLPTSNRHLLAVPRFRLNTYGRRVFSAAGPMACI